MATNKPQLKTYIENEYYEKFKVIADKEQRTVSNLLKTLVIEKVGQYENNYGTIHIENAKNVITGNSGTIINN